MARGTTLGRLLTSLRAECRLSLNPAHNNQVRDAQIELLQRHQERLWDDYPWPHLRVRRELRVQAGERYYDPPEDIHVDNIETVEFRFGARWEPILPGIEPGHYATWDSDADIRSWPVTRWQIHEDEQIELWPIPSDEGVVDGDGMVRVTGIRNLKRLVDDADRADLDDKLIVLFAAAEHLAARGEKDAKLKLDAANQRYLRLRGKLAPRRSFRVGAACEDPYAFRRRGPPMVHYHDKQTG